MPKSTNRPPPTGFTKKLGTPTPCPKPGARSADEPTPARPSRDIAVPIRVGQGSKRFWYSVDARRVEFLEQRSAAGLVLKSARLQERRCYLRLIPIWIQAGEIHSNNELVIGLAVRAFLRTGHVPAEQLL